MARTIQSPGVELKEFDRTQRASLPSGTNILVAGFADKGPTDEIVQVTSMSEFESIYGLPTTPAERYFYGTVRPLFNSPANIITYRMPYGQNQGIGFGNKYSALVYPINGVNNKTGDTLSEFSSGGDATYIMGEPLHIELTVEQYNNILQTKEFKWDKEFASEDDLLTFQDDLSALGGAGMIILNKGRTSINQKYEGFYIGAIDNTDLNPTTNYDGILNVNTLTSSITAISGEGYTSLPSARLDFSLSSSSDASEDTFGQTDDSVSEIMENLSPYEIDGRNFDDILSIGVFKLSQSQFALDAIKLTNTLAESYVGSVDYFRQQNAVDGGAAKSFHLGTLDQTSPNVDILINDNLSNKNYSTTMSVSGQPTVKVRFAKSQETMEKLLSSSPEMFLHPEIHKDDSNYIATLSALSAEIMTINNILKPVDALYPIGFYSNTTLDTKKIGNVPKKLDRLLDSIENVDIFDIDISVDGGLSTIYANSESLSSNFDDTAAVPAIEGLHQTNIADISAKNTKDYISDWLAVTQRFSNFAELKRKDHIFISDLPRNLFVEGDDFLTLTDPNKNFSKHMLTPIKAFTSKVNNNYTVVYGQWVKTFDSHLDRNVYTPFSGFAAQIMANTDANFQPWFAPAGFTRGRVTGASDLALFPTQKQRDQLYKLGVNPVAFFPGEGFTVFGQKTMQKLPSAFDRINVRRLFLYLEKATRETVKFFVFEPNTLLTRTRVVNTLTPLFENAKNTEGLYDYLIVCDERNNTPDVIDQNELIVDIYLKPVRAAEFILVNFYATRTGTDFSELIG